MTLAHNKNMTRGGSIAPNTRCFRSRPAGILASLALLAAASVLAGRSGAAQQSSAAGEWRYYYGDVYARKYSPLDQINKQNVKQLQVAWRRFTPDHAVMESNSGLRAARNQETPLMVNGVLYTVSGLGVVAALDPKTGVARWSYDPESY